MYYLHILSPFLSKKTIYKNLEIHYNKFMNIYKKILLLISIASILLFSIFLFYSFENNSSSCKEDFFVIKKGDTLKTVSENLKNEKFIKNSRVFYFLFYFNNEPKNIKAGTYKLNCSMSVFKIIDRVVKGDVVKEKITILEGWKINDIANYLDEKELFSKEEFFNVAGTSGLGHPSIDFSSEFEFLNYKPKNLSLEGFLFPDTYYINKNDSVEIIIKKMLSNFENKVWINIKNKESFYSNLILSSLIEKEVRGMQDKQMISNILFKRLENYIPLQVDATVIYANETENNDYVFDTSIDSPFNTYKYQGLPVGPICNPGLESIEAALNPIENNYWYYLSAKDGTTIFSKNFEEHKSNKFLYLR